MLTTDQLHAIDKLIRSNLSETKWGQQELNSVTRQ